MEKTDKRICKDCIFANFPHGRAKIKAGTCFKLAGNDFLPVNILKQSKGCEYWEKKTVKNKPIQHRWWKRKVGVRNIK